MSMYIFYIFSRAHIQWVLTCTSRKRMGPKFPNWVGSDPFMSPPKFQNHTFLSSSRSPNQDSFKMVKENHTEGIMIDLDTIFKDDYHNPTFIVSDCALFCLIKCFLLWCIPSSVKLFSLVVLMERLSRLETSKGESVQGVNRFLQQS